MACAHRVGRASGVPSLVALRRSNDVAIRRGQHLGSVGASTSSDDNQCRLTSQLVVQPATTRCTTHRARRGHHAEPWGGLRAARTSASAASGALAESRSCGAWERPPPSLSQRPCASCTSTRPKYYTSLKLGAKKHFYGAPRAHLGVLAYI